MTKTQQQIVVCLVSVCVVLFTLVSSLQAADTSDSCSSPETPNVWLGDAPYCETNDSYCGYFALDYICNDTKGDDGDECVNGTKVLCSYPAPEPLPAPTPVTLLKVLAYNVWELRYLYAQSGQIERTCRIPEEVFTLHPNLDVIVFNEVFMGGCVYDDSLTIRNIISEHGFVHYTGTVGDPPTPRKPENGGVFIASRWPIKVEEQIVYENSQQGTADAVSGKGCMYAQIEKTVEAESKVYHIFGTHLQAQSGSEIDEVRVLQAGEMHTFMLAQNIPANEPVIYAGDLNADKINNTNHAADVLMTLEANLPQIVGELDSTYDAEINDIFFEDSDNVAWLDYALYSDIHIHPTWSTLEVVRPRYATPFTVCMAAIPPRHFYPHEEDCLVTKVITDLSDHFAVLGTFDYGMEPEPTPSRPVIQTTSGGQRSIGSVLILTLSLLVSYFSS